MLDVVDTALLVVGAVGLLLGLNAWFPTRNRLLMGPSFFASWLAVELAPWYLFWQVLDFGIIRTCLQQQDRARRSLRQARRQNCPG